MLMVDRQKNYALVFGKSSGMYIHSENYLRIWTDETYYRDFKYQDEAAAKDVFDSIVKAYGRGDNVFEIPEVAE